MSCKFLTSQDYSVFSRYTANTKSQYTLALWVQMQAGGNFSNLVLGKGWGSYFNGGSATQLNFYQNFTGSQATWQFNLNPVGVWQHLAYTLDASSVSNQPTLYVNGSPVSLSVVAAPVGTQTQDGNSLWIGHGNSGNPLNGTLAHVGYWNGIMLTQADVSLLANGAPPLLVRPDSLVSYIPLTGTDKPQPDLILGTTTLSGVGPLLGASDPPAQNLSRIYSMLINSAIVPPLDQILAYQRMHRFKHSQWKHIQ